MRRCATRRPATFAVLLAALFLPALSALAGTLTPVKLRVGGKEVALKTPAIYDGREVYLPLESLQALGATYTMGNREETALVLLPNRIRMEIALARPGRQPMIPLSVLAPPLNQTFVVRDGVCEVRGQGTGDREQGRDDRRPTENTPSRPPTTDHRPPTTDPVQSAQSPDGRGTRGTPFKTTGNKTADKTDKAIETRAPSGSPPGRSTNGPAAQKTEAGAQANDPIDPKTQKSETQKTEPPKTEVKKPDLQKSGLPKPDAQKTESVNRGMDETLTLNLPPFGTLPPEARSAAKPFVPTVRIQDVGFEPLKGDRAQVCIKTRGKPDIAVRYLREPSRLAIDIPSSTLEATQSEWKIEHPFLSGMKATEGEKPGTTRVVLDLASLVGYRIEPASDSGVTLTLLKPTGVGRKMQNMTLVLDPGHGGASSTGCSASVNGVRVYEKNLTLSIAKKLQTMLTEVGVDVIMTRTSDVDVSLRERPEIANRNGANLFVSIHVDDCGIPNSASGSTAYYHMNDPSSRALAHSIIERMAKVSGMPNRGARSDSVRFRTGMAVLRYSRIPAVLIETAYINNDRDRKKLMDEEFQLVLARAMFNGIHAYAEGALPEDTLSPMGMN